MNNKGQVAYFFVFVFVAIGLLFLFAVATPFLQTFNIEAYKVGETIINDAQGDIDEIQNTEVRESIDGLLTAQQESMEGQTDVLGVFFQYGWIIIIVVLVLLIFMATRQTVESEVR